MKIDKNIDCHYCSNKGKDCTCGWVETINAVKNMPMRSYVVLHDEKDHIQGDPKKVNKPYDKDIDRHLAEGASGHISYSNNIWLPPKAVGEIAKKKGKWVNVTILNKGLKEESFYIDGRKVLTIKKRHKPYDPDIDRHLVEGIEWGSLFFILAFILVGIAFWVLTHLSEIL